MATLFPQPHRELASRCRLAGTLQAEQDHHPRPLRRRREPALAVAKQREHFVANDLDDRLRCREALEDVLLHRPVAYAVDEGLDDLEVYVRFEQGESNLA